MESRPDFKVSFTSNNHLGSFQRKIVASTLNAVGAVNPLGSISKIKDLSICVECFHFCCYFPAIRDT